MYRCWQNKNGILLLLSVVRSSGSLDGFVARCSLNCVLSILLFSFIHVSTVDYVEDNWSGLPTILAICLGLKSQDMAELSVSILKNIYFVCGWFELYLSWRNIGKCWWWYAHFKCKQRSSPKFLFFPEECAFRTACCKALHLNLSLWVCKYWNNENSPFFHQHDMHCARARKKKSTA